MSIKLLKEKSNRNLKGNKFQILFAFFIIQLVSSIVIIINYLPKGPYFYIVLSALVLGLILALAYLNPGYYSMLLNVSRNQKIKISELFDKSFLFSKSIVIEVLNYIFKLLICLPIVFMLLYVVLPLLMQNNYVLNGISLYRGMPKDSNIICLVLLLIMIIFIIIYLTYRMAYFFLLDNPSFSSIKCMRASRKMMKKNKFKLFRIYLSYIPVYLLVIIICSLLFLLSNYLMTLNVSSKIIYIISNLYLLIILLSYIIVVPKMNVTIANYYDVLKGTYSDVKSRTINNNFNNVYFNDSANAINVQNSGVLDNYNKVMAEKQKEETNEVFDIQKEGK